MDNDFSQKITSAVVTVIAIVAILPTTFVYAQTTTTGGSANATTVTNATTGGSANATTAPIQLVTPSAAAQQIINSTKAQCEQARFLQARCVVLVYESPTTVVVKGLVSIFGGTPGSRGLYPNPFVW